MGFPLHIFSVSVLVLSGFRDSVCPVLLNVQELFIYYYVTVCEVRERSEEPVQ